MAVQVVRPTEMKTAERDGLCKRIFQLPESVDLNSPKSGPTCPSAQPSLTWIGATSRPCGAKNLIFGLWVNLIPAVCRFVASSKASSHQGQCIPAGSSISPPRRLLITLSIITMRSRLFPANSESDCLRFATSRPQFSESCGAAYRRINELLQSTSGPGTDAENSVQIHS